MSDIPNLLSYSEIDALLVREGMMTGETYDPHSAVRERHEQFGREIAGSIPEGDAELLRWLAERLPFRKTKAAAVAERLVKIAEKL